MPHLHDTVGMMVELPKLDYPTAIKMEENMPLMASAVPIPVVQAGFEHLESLLRIIINQNEENRQ